MPTKTHLGDGVFAERLEEGWIRFAFIDDKGRELRMMLFSPTQIAALTRFAKENDDDHN